MLKKIMPFNVATKIERGGLEELKDLFSEFAPLHILPADGHQSDLRIGIAEYLFREHRSHDRILEQMKRLGINIGSGVNQDADIFFCWKIGSNAGAFDSLQGSELDRRGGHCGTGMPCTDNGVSLAILDEIDGPGNGGIFFAA